MPVRRRFQADPVAVRDIRSFVKEEARSRSFSQEADDIVLAVAEACDNVILHAHSPYVELRLASAADRFEVEVSDQGVFGSVTPGAGFGLRLMHATMDRVTVQEGTIDSPGTRVLLTKRKATGQQ